MGVPPSLFAFPSVDALADTLRTYVVQAQEAGLARHETFKVAVSGGSLPNTLAKALLSPDAPPIDFSKWEIFFADERCVPLNDPDSNYGLLKTELLDKLPQSQGQPQVFPIDESKLEEDSLEIADAYQAQLLDRFAKGDSVRLPVFDLILLGCGPDGHTCSLFPGHELLRENAAWVAGIDDSPKPPPRRITLTLPVVTHATRIAFIATGSGKQEILRKLFDQDEGRSLPCGLVNEGGGDKVAWFCDDAAVQGVTFPRRGSL